MAEKINKEVIRIRTKNNKDVGKNAYELGVFCKYHNILVCDDFKNLYRYNATSKGLELFNLREYLENEFTPMIINETTLKKVQKYFRVIFQSKIRDYNAYLRNEETLSTNKILRKNYEFVAEEIGQEMTHQSQLKENYEIIDTRINGGK